MTLKPGSSASWSVGILIDTLFGVKLPRTPSHTPATVATAATPKLVPPAPIELTLLKVGSVLSKLPVKPIISFT